MTTFQAEHLLAGKWRGFVIAGKYRLLLRVGAGGMGSVYLCEHILMKRRVALKVLPAGQAEDKAALDRFHREARAVAALDHPNIVRAHDIDREDKLHFLVMEYVDGTSLQDVIKRFGPMNVLRAAHYVAQAAYGLQHAHEAGIVHRDIKPGNLLIDRTGTVKILDMGLARFFHDDRDELTKQYDATSVLGTADYLAPEQALDSHGVDIRADIYSLGATLYYLLAGQSPFQEGTVAQKLIWHQVREPRSIQEFRPDVPDELAAVINKMMAKKPEDRFQTPLELAEALSPWTQTPLAPPPEEEMPQLGPGGQPDGAGRSMPSGRVSSRVPQTGTARDPASGRSSRHFPAEAGSTIAGAAGRRSSDTPRTPVPGSPFASESRIHRFDDAGPLSSTVLSASYLPPDIAHDRRYHIWVAIAAACLITMIGYSGVILWAVTRHLGRAEAEEEIPRALPRAVPEPILGLVRSFEGHTQPVDAVAFSPDGVLGVFFGKLPTNQCGFGM